MKGFKKFHEFKIFMRVLSTGLVIAGYAFLGVWACNWLLNNGYPKFLAFLAIPVIAIFGMWQGWLYLNKRK